MSWQEDFIALQSKEASNIDDVADVTGIAKNDEIGFVHTKTGAGVIARDDGALEGYSDYGLGFRFDPDHQALLVFAPHIHLFTGSVKTHEQLQAPVYFDSEYKEVLELLEAKDEA